MGAVVEDAVEAVDSHVDILRSFRVKNGHVVSVPMRRISQQEQQDTMSGSEGFLDQGKHEVFHHFQRHIQREEQYAPVEGEDQPDTGGIRGSSSVHFNLPPSRLSSVEHGEVLSPGVISGSEAVEVINMDEAEQLDEDMRRLRAQKKWNDRRRQIEAEFQRLRHFSIQQQRAGRMRHSVSFGDDLEVQVACGTEFVRTSSNGSKTRNFSTVTSGVETGVRTVAAHNRNSVPVMHQLERSRSMPMRQPNEEGYPGRRQPKLETYEEEEEEDENDDVFDDNMLMGLPPKDIPCRAMSNSTEQLPSLNMDEIPFTDVRHDQGGASERQHSERSHGSTSSSRRGSKVSDQIEYVRQESTEEERAAAGRQQGSKKKRSQVRQELAKYYSQDEPVSGRRPSREEGEESTC